MSKSSKNLERKTKKEVIQNQNGIEKKFKKVEAEKIVWLKTKKDLVYLYDELINNKIIYGDSQKYILLKQHFTITEGKLSNLKIIRQGLKAYTKFKQSLLKLRKVELTNLRNVSFDVKYHSKPSEIIEDILTDLKNKVNPQ